MLLILLGLAGLWLGTKWLMNGDFGIAERLQLSHAFVGVAILAVGTDLPVPLHVDRDLLQFDLPFLTIATITTLLFLRSERGISKREGSVLIVLFVLYTGLKILFFQHGSGS